MGNTKFPYPDTVFKTVMSGRSLKAASVRSDPNGAPEISFELTDDGTKVFADYTKTHVGAILAIVLDNIVISAPRIQSAIPDGKAEIQGKFTREEASSMVAQMLSGPLPVRMSVIQRRVIYAGD